MIQITEEHFEALQKVVEESRHVIDAVNTECASSSVASGCADFVRRAIDRLEYIRQQEWKEV